MMGFTAAVVFCFIAFYTVQQCRAQEAKTGLRQIPDFIKVCGKKNPKLNECVTKSVEEIRPLLAEGIPELNVPAIEPLELGDITALQGGGIRIRASDTKAYGCSDFTISNMRVDLSRNHIEFQLDFPLLYVVATYKVDGRILLLPIYGDGPLTGNFTDCKGYVDIQGSVVQRDGANYYYIDRLDVKFSVSKGTMILGNLFGGDQTLGNVVNNVINTNFDTFVREIAPSIERALSAKMKEIANNVVREFTYEQLYPPGE